MADESGENPMQPNAGGADAGAGGVGEQPGVSAANAEASGATSQAAGTAQEEARGEEAAATGKSAGAGGFLAGASNGQLALISLLVGSILAVVALGVYYRLTGTPVSALPGIQAVAKQLPPRYITSIMGADQPMGVAVTPDGNRIYAVEAHGERLTVEYDRAGRVVAKLAPPDVAEGKRLPMYAALDSAGRLYVTDRLRQVVDVYDPEKGYLMPLEIVDDKGQGVIPLGINYAGRDSSGQQLLAITQAEVSQRVLLTTLDGKVVRTVRFAPGQAGLQYSNAAVVDKQGRIFAADGNGNRIAVFGPDGNFMGEFGRGDKEGSVGVPRGLYLDRQNRLHIVDLSSHQIVVYDVSAQPTYLFTFGEYGIGNGQLNYPNGIAGDAAGRLYIADTHTGRIQVWTY